MLQIMQLLIMQHSPPSCHFIPRTSKYSPEHPVLKHPYLRSSLDVRDCVSHPYKTTYNSREEKIFRRILRCKEYSGEVRSDVLTATSINIAVFRDVVDYTMQHPRRQPS
jgi:putative component of membrane protein insertase Oxa1/YidC/SpoIIIJ protein YidD